VHDALGIAKAPHAVQTASYWASGSDSSTSSPRSKVEVGMVTSERLATTCATLG
jgi:hypothetical protein